MTMIAFVGGGTLGPVTPLLAVARVISRQDRKMRFVWFGTPDGPEKAVVGAEGYTFVAIPVAKLSRNLGLELFSFPFDLLRAHREARRVLLQYRPSIIVGAGGFTQVPVMREASKLGIPCAIHQLDVVPGLSNRLVAKQCQSVTTSFTYTHSPFGRVSFTNIATPVRFSSSNLPSREDACQHFGFDPKMPVVLVVGGGTGAQAINRAISESLDQWMRFTQILHVTGKGKAETSVVQNASYVQIEFLDAEGMSMAYGAADVVVTRAGIGALSEMASLSKVAVIVPIPDNQQEANARAFFEGKAGVYVEQSQEKFSAKLIHTVKQLLVDKKYSSQMSETVHVFFPTDDGSALAERILKLIS